MNSVIEKEKKLNLALTKLKNLNLKNRDIKKDITDLSTQKNQLEIEKQELEEKYKSLVNDYNDLSKKLEEFQNQEILLRCSPEIRADATSDSSRDTSCQTD